MYAIMCEIHPNDSVSHEFGIFQKGFLALKSVFPNYKDEILKLTSKTLTLIRLQRVNDEFNVPKSGPNTVRAATNVARFQL